MGVFDGVKGTAKTWSKRLFDPEERRNYWAAEGTKMVLILLYVVVNIALAIEAAIRYYNILKAVQPVQAIVWVCIARAFGQLLNFNCALIIVPTMRSVLSLARYVGLHHVLPLDKNIIFHRYIAVAIVIFGFGHALAHYMNYNCCYQLYGTPDARPTSPLEAAYADRFGLSGHIVTLCMVLMYSAANQDYRRSKNFTVFWYTHHFFIVFFAAMLVHGKNFWVWFVGPSVLYLIERILRVVRGASKTIVKKVHALPSSVLSIELEKPNFTYKPGQYCFVNCPLLSNHEWHPFTISSAPDEEVLTFHIRAVGDWTRGLMDLLNPAKMKTVVIDKPTGPDGKTHIIRVDGPFGAPAEHVMEYEYIMLIAAGIGVTPYASILKHIRNQMVNAPHTIHLKRVYFYWINRDEGSWEWFSDILNELETANPNFFEIHTFMTGELKAADIKSIVMSSHEVKGESSNPSSDKGPWLGRALYSYEPQSSDEIVLEEDDSIMVSERDESGWWVGKNQRTGAVGLFPHNYVTITRSEGSQVDKVTKMSDNRNRHFGRPNWGEQFASVREWVETHTPPDAKQRPKVGAFFCGPAVLSKQLYSFCVAESKVGRPVFNYHKENF